MANLKKEVPLTEGQIRKGGQNPKPSTPRPDVQVVGQSSKPANPPKQGKE